MNPYMRRRVLGLDRRSMSRRDRRRGYSDRQDWDDYDEAPRRRGRDMMYDDYPYEETEYDYASHGSDRLTRRDIQEWMHELDNADGSHGAKFQKDQIMDVLRQRGMSIDGVSEDEFVLTVNMMYSDYCCALRDSSVPNVDRPEPYINMAKAFLHDKDFDGTPSEKLAMYFYGVVEYDR